MSGSEGKGTATVICFVHLVAPNRFQIICLLDLFGIIYEQFSKIMGCYLLQFHLLLIAVIASLDSLPLTLITKTLLNE